MSQLWVKVAAVLGFHLLWIIVVIVVGVIAS